MEPTNLSEKKRSNKIKIAKFILRRGETSKPEIAAVLGISMPTVLQNVRELTEDGIVTEVGEYESRGGRKAKALAIRGDKRYSAGLDVTANHVSLVAVDLRGAVRGTKRVRTPFENTAEYYRGLGERMELFLDQTGVDRERLLGVGISLPGIVSRDADMLVRSHILGLKDVSLRNIRQWFPYDVAFENDANSAAMAEFNQSDRTAVYLSLSNSVGGAVWLDGAVYRGEQDRSAEFGHMILEKGGKSCYCGKQGCLDAYCSARVLADAAGGSLEEFFRNLTAGDVGARQVWDTYLDYLAVAVTNLRMAFDCEIVLGGYVGGYIERYLMDLAKKASEYNKFEDGAFYLKPCRYQREASAVGIAMGFLERYFDQLN